MGVVDDQGGDGSVRVTLEVSEGDASFLEAYARYRNALAKVQSKRVRRQWSRKMLAESFVAAQCDQARHQLQEMFAAIGPFPDPDDKNTTPEDFERYAKKVLAWDKKHGG